MSNIRTKVMAIPLALLLITVILSYTNMESFLNVTSAINNWMLSKLSWLFSGGALLMLTTLLIIYLSPLGKKRIGGENSTPLLSKWRWASIAVCTTTAAGMLFWGTAEPLYHLYGPPDSLNIEPNSVASATFALSTMFMHWSIIPFSIYALPALAFALALYNRSGNFSLGSSIEPLFGKNKAEHIGNVVDSLAMLALVAGMAASLGTGALVLSSGLSNITDLADNVILLGIVIFIIMISFIASSISGIEKGIARLSSLNAVLFVAIAIIAFIFGPSTKIVSGAVTALGEYITTFLPRSLGTVYDSDDTWPLSWTVFYWTNWLSWAPITALFLGKIARGYTVREFIVINLAVPAIFSIIWMSIFSGTILTIDMQKSGFYYQIMSEGGPGAVIYALLDQLPGGHFLILGFIFIVYLAYVTAADSNTEAISSLCLKKQDDNNQINRQRNVLKILFGTLIATVAWIMTGFIGIDGIKMLSNLGGFPAIIVVLLMNFSLFIWVYNSFLENKAKHIIQKN
ncbi:BCCT family transporter [Vibrio pelagius]|uniref:BCCT family transporter n=1 Tax=Vibrio pelagius TaxID=28169 RepID=UPI0021C4B4E8|nr:BCCT family transporter [Vibrio pelagius]